MISDGEVATWITGVRSFSGSTGGDFIVGAAMITLSAWPITMS